MRTFRPYGDGLLKYLAFLRTSSPYGTVAPLKFTLWKEILSERVQTQPYCFFSMGTMPELHVTWCLLESEDDTERNLKLSIPDQICIPEGMPCLQQIFKRSN